MKIKIRTLTKKIAIEFCDEIIELHNLIPFQRWSRNDLFFEKDQKRIFKYKWKISSICFIKNAVRGICFAFEDNQSKINNVSDFLYIHRIAVHKNFRFKDIGTMLIKHTFKNYKKINLQKSNKVIVSTPIKAFKKISFDNVEDFYLKLGFHRVGFKKYKNKIDAILIAPL